MKPNKDKHYGELSECFNLSFTLLISFAPASMPRVSLVVEDEYCD